MSLKIMESHKLSALIGIHPIPNSVGSSATAREIASSFSRVMRARNQRTFYRFEKLSKQPELDDGKCLTIHRLGYLDYNVYESYIP